MDLAAKVEGLFVGDAWISRGMDNLLYYQGNASRWSVLCSSGSHMLARSAHDGKLLADLAVTHGQ